MTASGFPQLIYKLQHVLSTVCVQFSKTTFAGALNSSAREKEYPTKSKPLVLICHKGTKSF